jgi:hypothetical protein
MELGTSGEIKVGGLSIGKLTVFLFLAICEMAYIAVNSSE